MFNKVGGVNFNVIDVLYRLLGEDLDNSLIFEERDAVGTVL